MGELFNIKEVAFNINACATKNNLREVQNITHSISVTWFGLFSPQLPPYTPQITYKQSLIHHFESVSFYTLPPISP